MSIFQSLAVDATTASPKHLAKATDTVAPVRGSALPALSDDALLLASRLAVDGAGVLVFASAEIGITTGRLTADIGRALAHLGHGPVLLLEADETSRSMQKYVQLGETPGLLEALTAEEQDDDDLFASVAENVSALGWGVRAANPILMPNPFASPSLRALLVRMKRRFPWVLLSAPCPEASADAALAARAAESLILVVQRGRQSRSRLNAMQSRLAAAKLPLRGIVLV